MAAVGETEDAFVEFQGYVNMDATFGFGLVGFGQEFFGVGKPEELPVELEVEGDDSFGQLEPEVFSLPLDGLDFLAFCCARELRGRLRFRGDGVEDVDAADLVPFD